jgi:hypothetical protein
VTKLVYKVVGKDKTYALGVMQVLGDAYIKAPGKVSGKGTRGLIAGAIYYYGVKNQLPNRPTQKEIAEKINSNTTTIRNNFHLLRHILNDIPLKLQGRIPPKPRLPKPWIKTKWHETREKKRKPFKPFVLSPMQSAMKRHGILDEYMRKKK